MGLKPWSFVAVILVSILTIFYSGWLFANDYAAMQRLYLKRQFTQLDSLAGEILKRKNINDELKAEALYFLIAMRIFKGKYAAAVPYMQRFEKVHQQLARKRWAQEKAALKNAPEGSAVFLYIDSRFVGLYYELGKYHVQNKRYRQAYNWLLMAKSSSRLFNDPAFNFYLALTNLKLGHYDEARKYFKRQLKYAPDEPSPYYNISCSYALEGDATNAVNWLRRAINARPKFRIQARTDNDFSKIRNKKTFRLLVWGKE